LLVLTMNKHMKNPLYTEDINDDMYYSLKKKKKKKMMMMMMMICTITEDTN